MIENFYGVDLGNITTIACVKPHDPGKYSIEVLRQVVLDEGRSKFTDRLRELYRVLAITIPTGSVILTIEKPPMIQNLKTFQMLSAYWGVAMVIAGQHCLQDLTETLAVAEWRKRINANVNFKKGEFEPGKRKAITKEAVIIRVRELTGRQFKDADSADAVGLAIAGHLRPRKKS